MNIYQPHSEARTIDNEFFHGSIYGKWIFCHTVKCRNRSFAFFWQIFPLGKEIYQTSFEARGCYYQPLNLLNRQTTSLPSPQDSKCPRIHFEIKRFIKSYLIRNIYFYYLIPFAIQFSTELMVIRRLTNETCKIEWKSKKQLNICRMFNILLLRTEVRGDLTSTELDIFRMLFSLKNKKNMML